MTAPTDEVPFQPGPYFVVQAQQDEIIRLNQLNNALASRIIYLYATSLQVSAESSQEISILKGEVDALRTEVAQLRQDSHLDVEMTDSETTPAQE
jgi:hypothetical protein